MQNRNILITGGTDGMGKATALQLAKMGAQLLLIGRNHDKGEAAVAEIICASGSQSVRFLQADLSLMREVRRTAEQTRQMFHRLDVLVHSAGGVFPKKRTLTDEGVELSFAVQCLARYALTAQLLDLFAAAPAAQVVSIAGGGTTPGRVDFDNLNGEKSYSEFGAIAQTGRINDLITLEQVARYPEIRFYNYGPGFVRTAILERTLFARLFFNTLGRPFTRSAEQAADDIVALLAGEYPSGLYGRSLKRNEPSAKMDAISRVRIWDYMARVIDNQLTKKPPAVQ